MLLCPSVGVRVIDRAVQFGKKEPIITLQDSVLRSIAQPLIVRDSKKKAQILPYGDQSYESCTDAQNTK